MLLNSTQSMKNMLLNSIAIPVKVENVPMEHPMHKDAPAGKAM